MAVENLGKVLTLTAGEDLSTRQYCFVSLENILDGKIRLCGDGQPADGVLQDNPSLAQVVGNVMVGEGISKLRLGGTVHAGAWAASDSQGRGVEAATGDFVLGTFMEGGDVNEVISILFQSRPSKL